MEVIDDFISYEVLKNVSPSFHGNQRGRHLDFEEDEWEEYVPDMKLQARGISQSTRLLPIYHPPTILPLPPPPRSAPSQRPRDGSSACHL